MATRRRSSHLTMEDLFPSGFRGLPADDAQLAGMAEDFALEALGSVPTGRLHVDELMHQANIANQMIAAGYAPEALQRLQQMGVGQMYMPPQAMDTYNQLAMSLYDALSAWGGETQTPEAMAIQAMAPQALAMYQRAPQANYMTTQNVAREMQYASELAQRGMVDEAYELMQRVRPEPRGGLMDSRVRDLYGGAAEMMASIMAADGTVPEADIQNMIAALAYAPQGGHVPVQSRLSEYALSDALRRILTGHRMDREGRPGMLPQVAQYLALEGMGGDHNVLQRFINSLLD